MNELKTAFFHWASYAEDSGCIYHWAVEKTVRAQQPKINAITYRPPDTPAHVVPARIMALLLTALEAIAIHNDEFIAECVREEPYDPDYKANCARRAFDQKALIRGYLRQLKPFIFEESTPEAPQPTSDA